MKNSQRLSLRRYRPWMILAMLWVLVSAAYAQPPVSENQDDAGIEFAADQFEFDMATDSYLLMGNVSISDRGRTLTADRVLYNQSTREAVADGHVSLISNGDRLEGEHLRLNLDTEVGRLTRGTVFSADNHLYLSGDIIEKTGPATYETEEAVLTSCDGDQPAWRITASDLKITIEGYGVARHAALWARRWPVMYTPFLAFPVKLQRQTGLLTPQIGHSTRKGTEFLQPFYWAISPSSDATFYAHLMSERGMRSGVEYRYLRTPKSLGTILAEGFNDRQVDDGSGDTSEKWGYTSDNALRPNEDRYWIRAKVNQELPAGFRAKLDLDVVSDQDYLNEFKSVLYGFNQSRDDFIDTFGRDLDDYTDPIRSNRFNVARSWRKYALNMDLRWDDNVIRRRQAETDTTLQRLPSITFNGIRQRVGRSPFYFDLTSNYTYFYRQDGDKGQRADLHPRLYYPFFVLQGISVEPSVGVRQSVWAVDREADTADEDFQTHRSLYDLKLNLQTEFYRIFDRSDGGVDRIKHAITPEVAYDYIPDVDQSDLPYFDDTDRIEALNRVTFSLTNSLTLRRPRPAETRTTYQYRSFLRFKISQGFDIDTPDKDDDNPLTDLTAELDITPGRWVSIDADAAWSHDNDRFNAYNLTARLWDRRGDRLEAIYRFTREDIEEDIEPVDSIGLEGRLVISERWRLRGAYELDRVDQEEIQTRLGVSYQSQCWGVDVDYTVEDQDQSVTVMVHLFGLGSFGN